MNHDVPRINPPNTLWVMRISEKGPGMNQESVLFSARTYDEAVQTVREEWTRTGQSVSLASGPYDMYMWYMIVGHRALNRNSHSKFSSGETLQRKDSDETNY